MAQVKDPVCGMTVDTATAAGSARFEGETYYFCSDACKQTFDANPRNYANRGGAVRAASDSNPDARVEPEHPHTHKGFPAPKFGSAGSGGAELEPGPDRNRRS